MLIEICSNSLYVNKLQGLEGEKVHFCSVLPILNPIFARVNFDFLEDDISFRTKFFELIRQCFCYFKPLPLVFIFGEWNTYLSTGSSIIICRKSVTEELAPQTLCLTE